MRDYRIAALLRGVEDDGGTWVELQRRLLLELITAPPPQGETIEVLARALRAPRGDLVWALMWLGMFGLASWQGDVVRASPAALRFDTLWPVTP